MNPKFILVVLLIGIVISRTEAGILGLFAGYGACQTACNATWVTCCAAAGVVAGIRLIHLHTTYFTRF